MRVSFMDLNPQGELVRLRISRMCVAGFSSRTLAYSYVRALTGFGFGKCFLCIHEGIPHRFSQGRLASLCPGLIVEFVCF